MYWLYILANKVTDRYYIGSTDNLSRRLKQHLAGSVRTTKILGIKELVFTEEYNSLEEARLREKKLKSYKSKKYIKWLISNNSLLGR